MTREEKARAYDEALKRAVEFHKDTDRHLKATIERIFPELKESEDEGIRKIITDSVFYQYGAGVEYKDVLDYLDKLEKQKEQKPVEWSEEFLRLMGITISQDGNQVCVLLGENLAEGIAGFGDTLADAVEEFKKEWRQFDRFRKATWKPSEEQMVAFQNSVEHIPHAYYEDMRKLYEQLKKLM